MAVHIRLQRIGRRKRPFYRVVVMDSRTRRDGREIENIGWFDPLKEGERFSYDEERAIHWMKQGATPTERVYNIFKDSGLALKWHLMKIGKTTEEIAEAVRVWRDEKEAKELRKAEKAAAKAAEKPAEVEEITTTEEDTEKSIEPEPEAEVEAPAEEVEAPADEKVEES